MIKLETKETSQTEKEECIETCNHEEGSTGQFLKQHMLVEQQQRDIQVIHICTALELQIDFFLPGRLIFQLM